MRRHSIAFLLLVLILLLAACGGGGASEGNTDTNTGETEESTGTDTGDTGATEGGGSTAITVNVDNDLAYDPAQLSAPAGEVEITLANTGALEHNIVWVDNEPEVFVTTLGGETASNSRSFAEPGNYDFYCSVPGHREAGMTGTLTVTE